MSYHNSHLTKAAISLNNLRHNMELIQSLAGQRPLYPAIKANAYGHGAEIIGRELIRLGYTTLCTAHLNEAAELVEKGLNARFITLSPSLPENSPLIVEYGFEPVVCNEDVVRSLAAEAKRRDKCMTVHVKVDTGMGRVGVAPQRLSSFLEFCQQYPSIRVESVCTHFPKADADDLDFSHHQVKLLTRLQQQCVNFNIPKFHCANSAAIFALPEAKFNACRPGISIYGLKPDAGMTAPHLDGLQPVLSLSTRITHLQHHESGTGISYGHTWQTERTSLIATIPLGYGDGISRTLSNRLEVLINGHRCPQIGRICMDQCMIDVTAIAADVSYGDVVTIIGSQGDQTISADDLAATLGTINYEIVTALSARVARVAV